MSAFFSVGADSEKVLCHLALEEKFEQFEGFSSSFERFTRTICSKTNPWNDKPPSLPRLTIQPFRHGANHSSSHCVDL